MSCHCVSPHCRWPLRRTGSRGPGAGAGAGGRGAWWVSASPGPWERTTPRRRGPRPPRLPGPQFPHPSRAVPLLYLLARRRSLRVSPSLEINSGVVCSHHCSHNSGSPVAPYAFRPDACTVPTRKRDSLATSSKGPGTMLVPASGLVHLAALSISLVSHLCCSDSVVYLQPNL